MTRAHGYVEYLSCLLLVGGTFDVLRWRTYVLLRKSSTSTVRRVGFCSRLSHLSLLSTATLCVCTYYYYLYHFTLPVTHTIQYVSVHRHVFLVTTYRTTYGSNLLYVHIGSIKLVMKFDGDSPYYCCCTRTYILVVWENVRGVESSLGEFCAKDTTTYCCMHKCARINAICVF